MKPIETFKEMGKIDERYINEADEDREKQISNQKNDDNAALNQEKDSEKPLKGTKKRRLFTWASLAAAIAVILIVGFIMPYVDNSKHTAALHTKAAEISKASLNFGATMPTIINVTDGRVIMYDYIGIWVYDINKEKLAGFCDLQELGMTQIQGDPCVIVESSADGKYVRFYWMTNESGDNPDDTLPMYVYDTYKDEYKAVKNFDGYDFNTKSELSESSDESLSSWCPTYELSDGSYITYILKLNDESDIVGAKYGDVYIVTEKDGKKMEYKVFDGE